MKYNFHPDALTEDSEAAQYYVNQRVDLAQSFIDAVEDAIYRLRELPQRSPILQADVRRCLTRQFPYALLYTVEPDSILILAVMHCRRSPAYW